MNVQKWREDFCVCDGHSICEVCQANLYYRNYEYRVYEKCLGLNFLADVRENISRNLEKLLTLDSHFVCKIVNENFQYSDKDWFTRDKVLYDLEVCLQMWEQKKLIKLSLMIVRCLWKSSDLFSGSSLTSR